MRALVWLAVAACGGFPRDAAEAGCAHAQACDEAGLVEAFGTVDECVRRERHVMEDVARDAADAALECTFDKDKAADCLENLETADCATFNLQKALTDCAPAFGCFD